MADCFTVVSLAMQRLGVLGAGQTPRPADLSLGITTLQALFRQLISDGALGRARPVVPDGDYTARENDRVLRLSSNVGSITLPELVTDEIDQDCWDDRYYDEPVCSRPRPPRDGAFIIINDAVTGGSVEYIYEAYINAWVSLHDLSAQQYQEVTDPLGNVVEIIQPSTCPLSTRDLTGLVALLATKISDYFGATITPAMVSDAQNWKDGLSTRFGEPETVMVSDLWCFNHTRY